MKSGEIACKVRERARDYVKVGSKVIDVCEKVETWIKELGGLPAFPCNVDINEIAAHYTSPWDDSSIIPPDSLVKIDIGVHIDGYPADTAVTVCFNPELNRLVEAAEMALEAGIRSIKADVKASEVGYAIENTIRSMGLKPIRNLTGHKMARYVIHAGEIIPNVSTLDGHKLREGEVYAVEPFTTLLDASGEVRDGPSGYIFQFQKKRAIEGKLSKEILKMIQTRYRTLPFASRWIMREFPKSEAKGALEELLRSKCIHAYPQLIEMKNRPVAQAEHTLIVTKDGCEVTTAKY
ncbi:type II methionyl aminopeptidase [Candidatus Bathyarchaeota archaeon]|nr:type II methionyl aminopeptidase [Candidatus Bathyarchaeota archaeon]